MKLKIGNNYYNASPSFMTMLKYRAEHGISFLDEQSVDKETLAKLIYVAIQGEKTYFHIFINDCRADSLFEATALMFYKRLLQRETQENNSQSSGEAVDEYKILALFSIANLPDSMLDTLNIFQIMSVVNHYCNIKNGNQQAKEMTSDERKSLYGITPEKEQEIECYLRNGGENIGR